MRKERLIFTRVRVTFVCATLMCACIFQQDIFCKSAAKPVDQKVMFARGPASSALSQIMPVNPQNIDSEKNIFKWFRTFSEAIHLIVQKHYKQVDIPSFIQDALKAALPKTDPHSSFFSQKSYKAAIESTSGEFSGIGVSIMNKSPEDDTLVVIDVIQGGPSDKAGLKAGDQIISVNGNLLRGLSSDEVITNLRGKVGSKVNLKFLRDKRPLELTITRQVIKDQNLLCYHFKNQNIYYFSLKLFAENTHRQMTKLLKKAYGNKCQGMIIDVRRNPGGILDSAVNMVSLFVDKGNEVVSTKNKDGKTLNRYQTNGKPISRSNPPIFMITDNFTASAAEIFVGCMKHYSEKNHNNLMVFHVGSETFGKGSVQEMIPISNGCALKITTMTYFLPDDTPIQAKGIAADRKMKRFVLSKEMPIINLKENELKNCIPADGKKPEKKKAAKIPGTETKEELAKNWEERYRQAVCDDPQIQNCINMINMVNLAKKHTPQEVQTRQKALDFLKTHYTVGEKLELTRVA